MISGPHRYGTTLIIGWSQGRLYPFLPLRQGSWHQKWSAKSSRPIKRGQMTDNTPVYPDTSSRLTPLANEKGTSATRPTSRLQRRHWLNPLPGRMKKQNDKTNQSKPPQETPPGRTSANSPRPSPPSRAHPNPNQSKIESAPLVSTFATPAD